MRRSHLWACVMLGSCGGPSAVGQREQESLGAVLQTVQAVAAVVEVAHHGVLPGTGAEPTCPAVSRVQGFATIDYGDGCIPDSGLVRARMSGAIRLDVDDRVTARFAGLSMDDVDLEGRLDARATPVSRFDGVLLLDQPTPDGVVLALSVGLGQAPPYILHGTAQRTEGGLGVPVEFEEVELPVEGPCLAPISGTATVEQGLHQVAFRFTDDGGVVVSRSDGVEGTLHACDHARPLIGG